MAMTSNLQGTGEPVKPNPYPVLKRMRGLDDPQRQYIVLFTSKSTGVVVWCNEETQVSNGGEYSLGTYCKTWAESLFDPISDESMITMKN